MKKVRIDEVERTALSGPLDRRGLSEALGATNIVIVYYELNPGEPFSAAYHTHHSQEEVFYLLSGTAGFGTENGPVTVEAGEAIRFEPGEYQQGYVEADQDEGVSALALGAPPGMDETIITWECENCYEEGPHGIDLDVQAGWEYLYCQGCENRVIVLPKDGTDETSDLF